MCYRLIWPSLGCNIGILYYQQHISSFLMFFRNILFDIWCFLEYTFLLFPDNFMGIDWPAVSNCLKIPSPWKKFFSDIFGFIISLCTHCDEKTIWNLEIFRYRCQKKMQNFNNFFGIIVGLQIVTKHN